MSETTRMWVEISFNLSYLVAVWWLVGVMYRRRDSLPPLNRRAASLTTWAFALLALGDTGHVGFRVVAYALGGLEAQVRLLGRDVGLVGAGALSTAVTVTLFYMLVLELWRERFGRGHNAFTWLLLGAGVLRLGLMILPVNAWNSVVPPQPWSTVRNLPLVLQGLGAAALILNDAWRSRDRAFAWIGAMILLSFACYLPVILFVQQQPMLGMLMIPKTMAYVAIGLIAYFELYPRPAAGEISAAAS